MIFDHTDSFRLLIFSRKYFGFLPSKMQAIMKIAKVQMVSVECYKDDAGNPTAWLS